MALLLLRSEAACLVTQHKQIHDPAQPHGRNEARFLPRERFSPATRSRHSSHRKAAIELISSSVAVGQGSLARPCSTPWTLRASDRLQVMLALSLTLH